jgi:hypothetical protein
MSITDWLLLTLTVAAGALTQYIFTVITATGFLLLLGSLIYRKQLKTHLKRLGAALGALCLGYAALPLLHPGFQNSIQTAGDRSGIFSQTELSTRVNRVLSTITDFFIGKGLNLTSARFIVPTLALLLTIAWVTTWLTIKRRDPTRLQQTNADGKMALVALILGGTTILLYLTFSTPINAMGASYMAWVWPFTAILIVTAVGLFKPKWRTPALALIAAAFAISGLASAIRVDRAAATEANATTLIRTQNNLLLDTSRRGIVPGILWHAKPTQRVFAIKQKEALAKQNSWLPKLGNKALYIGGTTMASTPRRRAQIIGTLFTANYKVTPEGQIKLWFPLLTGTEQTVLKLSKKPPVHHKV